MSKSKNTMEVNGIANLHLLLSNDDATQNLSEETMKDIKEQLDLLERYMIAYQASVEAGKPNPFWHDIKANPSAYPLNGGRIKPR